jgi:hypothetical protein
MKNISTGTGIALLAGAIVAYPIIDRVMPRAEAGATHVAAVVAAATAQVPPEPTIVWYGTDTFVQSYSAQSWSCSTIWRAWSDGKVEAMVTRRQSTGYNGNAFDSWCSDADFCTSGWKIVSSPAQGLTYRSDVDFDSKVNGSDLAQVLNDWGDAPRQDIVPSTCPLNLINP